MLSAKATAAAAKASRTGILRRASRESKRSVLYSKLFSPSARQGQAASSRLLPRHFSAHSSIDEPNPTLFQADLVGDALADRGAAKTGQTVEREEMDARLRSDVRTMGSLLGRVIRDHDSGGKVFDHVETLRNLAKVWRESGAGRDPSRASDADGAFGSMTDFASSLTSKEIVEISRSFAHFLALANAAEAHHRCRINRRVLASELAYGSGALSMKRDSCGGAIRNLVNNLGVDPETIWKGITEQTVELVLTAHPTEVNRRTVLDKHKRVQEVGTCICQMLLLLLIPRKLC